MSACENCGARAQMFLCNRCTAELRDMLTHLPRWLNYLEQTAYGQVRFGSGGRRNTNSGGLVRYTDPTPEGDTTIGQRRFEDDVAAGKFDLTKVLAAGRVNTRAAERRDKVASMLSTWIRDICEIRGIDVPPLGSDVRSMAAWLAMCVGAVAASEGAGEFYDELGEHVRDIERIINPPLPPRFCGPCPTLVDHRKQCGTRLMAKRTAIEVTCPTCHQTHNIEALVTHLMNWADELRFTVADTLLIMDLLEEPLSDRTFRYWRQHNHIRVRGYQRPDVELPNGTVVAGPIGLTRRSADDKPVYRLAEVRKLRNRQEASA